MLAAFRQPERVWKNGNVSFKNRSKEDVLAGGLSLMTASLHGDFKGTNNEKESAVTVSVAEPVGRRPCGSECCAK
ncbi:hypothetical protein [Rahnella perminowiae]|uniref:hypothetical protein n=1 Tax=Rahnella perminowiae TaxID=2816244 RepID=UPI00215BFDA4|nr:hypothetical protein [Rahnella perminowiae]MCR9003105.1 hypothetical protein [Rahnella perminowiae]